VSYLYFPGCSLKGLGRAYEESLLAVFDTIGIDLKELTDWNCCGATAYMSIDEVKACALSARNLALADKYRVGEETIHLVVPCSGCYLELSKTQKLLRDYPELDRTIKSALSDINLEYHGKVQIRHPLDVLVNDLGLGLLSAHVTQPLRGLRVACYYGCQIVRPYSTFDDQHAPVAMERLLGALGAEVIDWPLKTRCCGGSLTGTVEEVGLRLNHILLKEAAKRKADVVATVCPLCQFNLECYQPLINKTFGDALNLPVVYFTQLMGLAFGLDPKVLGLQRSFIPLPAYEHIREAVER